MVAVKAHQAEAFLKPPGPSLAAVLFYGPDSGMVAERAAALAAMIAARDDPPGEIIRIDDFDLENAPDRLAVELQTMPMFGGSKIVRVIAGRRTGTPVLKPLLDSESLAATLIVEAGNLKPSDSLRALFEKSGKAAAVACFPDEAHDLESLVRNTLKAHGLSISPEARDLLIARVGADRALSRGEVEKLALYAAGKAEIEVSDVEAIVGDASELAIDRVLSAAASGDAARAVAEFNRAISAGESPQGIIAATQRYFQRLHRIRAEIDNGRSFEDAIRQLRPPVHFKQKNAIGVQCRMWTTARIGQALTDVAHAAKSARRSASLEKLIAERLMLRLAGAARPAERSHA